MLDTNRYMNYINLASAAIDVAVRIAEEVERPREDVDRSPPPPYKLVQRERERV